MYPFSFDMIGPGSFAVLGGAIIVVLIFIGAVAVASIAVLVILIRKKKQQNDAEDLRTFRRDPPKA